MPKIKTHRASAKRFKKRGSGKLKRRNAYSTHLLGHRSTKRKRGSRKTETIDAANMENVKRALGMK